MKNRLALFMLLSLSTGVVMHASDEDKQNIIKLVEQSLPGAIIIGSVSSSIHLPTIQVSFDSNAKNIPTCMYKSVFTYKGMDYVPTGIRIVFYKLGKHIISGTTELTLIPKAN